MFGVLDKNVLVNICVNRLINTAIFYLMSLNYLLLLRVIRLLIVWFMLLTNLVINLGNND